MSKPKIYCFINGGILGWLNVVGIAEDGHILSGHASSNELFAKHDIGITSDWKHDNYKEHYPDGYELEWIDCDDLSNHKGLNEACKKNNELAVKEDKKGEK